MATYTLYLHEAIEILYGESMDEDDYEQPYESLTFNGVTWGRLPILADHGVKLGLGTYPIFDENYRDILNGLLIDQYYTREIGRETIDQFTHTIRRKMDQIMPYYNKLFETELIDYQALSTMDIRSEGENESEAEEVANAQATQVSDSNAKSRAVNSNTPQTMLSGNGDYATAATDSNSDSIAESESNSDSNSNSTNKAKSLSRVTGFQGVASELVTRYRNTILNLNQTILGEVEDCFMLVFNNADAYARREWTI